MTRFPEPGKTKTRLIPALGPALAAALHHDLITHTLNIVQRSASQYQWRAQVRFFGGDEQQFREQFGTQLNYVPQSEGTLGDRMNAAVAAAFQDGAERVVVIGTDCPLLDESHLTTAFEHLAHHDVVIGPATDGGYYLIGMRKHLPPLFEDISWGTEIVLQQTLARAKSIGVSSKELTSLSDVDYMEDLIQCRKIEDTFGKTLPQTTTGRISVIIPTWNEAENITHTLRQFRNVPVVEIIVADGGSTDHTVALAQAAGTHVINCNPGRGKQMNAGAALASGEVLLFLHADTKLPNDFCEHIWHAMNNGSSGGAFRLQIDAQGWMLRVVEFGANLRSRWLKLPYGDQAIFVRASAFSR